MYRNRRYDPRYRPAGTQPSLAAYRGSILFKDPGTNEELILSPGGEIRDKAGNTVFYDQEGNIHRKKP